MFVIQERKKSLRLYFKASYSKWQKVLPFGISILPFILKKNLLKLQPKNKKLNSNFYNIILS